MSRGRGVFVSLQSQDALIDGPSTSGKRSLRTGRQWISGESGLAAKTRVARLDTRVDDRDTLVVSDEGALHRVYRKALHVGEGEAGDPREALEFFGQRHVGHETVIRIHRHAETLCDEVADRMFRQRRYSPGIHVR